MQWALCSRVSVIMKRVSLLMINTSDRSELNAVSPVYDCMNGESADLEASVSRSTCSDCGGCSASGHSIHCIHYYTDTLHRIHHCTVSWCTAFTAVTTCTCILTHVLSLLLGRQILHSYAGDTAFNSLLSLNTESDALFMIMITYTLLHSTPAFTAVTSVQTSTLFIADSPAFTAVTKALTLFTTDTAVHKLHLL